MVGTVGDAGDLVVVSLSLVAVVELVAVFFPPLDGLVLVSFPSALVRGRMASEADAAAPVLALVGEATVLKIMGTIVVEVM